MLLLNNVVLECNFTIIVNILIYALIIMKHNVLQTNGLLKVDVRVSNSYIVF